MPTPLRPITPETDADRLARVRAMLLRGPGPAGRRELDALRWLLGEYDRLSHGLDPDPFPAQKGKR